MLLRVAPVAPEGLIQRWEKLRVWGGWLPPGAEESADKCQNLALFCEIIFVLANSHKSSKLPASNSCPFPKEWPSGVSVGVDLSHGYEKTHRLLTGLHCVQLGAHLCP